MRKTRSDKGKKRTPYGRRTPPKFTNKELALQTLNQYSKRLLQAINYNKQVFKGKKLQSWHSKAIIKPQIKKYKEIQREIKQITNSLIRVTPKALAYYNQIFKEPVFKIESEYEQIGLVYDRETNYRNMILTLLQNEGVNVYNPTELFKVLKGYDLHDLTEFIELDEGENYYEYLQENGVVKSIKELVHKKYIYEKNLAKKYNVVDIKTR